MALGAISSTGELSASLMCAHLGRLGSEVAALDRAGIDSFHVDVMDGHFVPNLALTADILAALRPLSARLFYVHAMVLNPEMYVEPMAAAGCDVFLFHIESCRYPHRLIAQIERSGMTPGVALNPTTPTGLIESFTQVPYFLVMTVEPGYGGDPWIGNSPDRVRAVRRLAGDYALIIVDGHVDLRTAPILAAAGANVFVCGTRGLFRGGENADDYAAELAGMRGSLAGNVSVRRS